MSERKVVVAMNFDLLRVLEGHELAVETTDGEEVFLRLYTPEELLARNAASRAEQAEYDPHFLEVVPAMTRQQAEKLTRPIPSTS